MTIQETTSLSETSVLRFSIFLTLQGEKVKTLHTRKYRRIFHLLEKFTWDSAHLIVRYGDKGENEGVYTSSAELRAALSSFIEGENIEYLMGGAS
jgi:hypothetical protein